MQEDFSKKLDFQTEEKKDSFFNNLNNSDLEYLNEKQNKKNEDKLKSIIEQEKIKNIDDITEPTATPSVNLMTMVFFLFCIIFLIFAYLFRKNFEIMFIFVVIAIGFFVFSLLGLLVKS